MNTSKLKTSSITFFLTLVILCFLQTGLVKAASMPAKYNMTLDFNADTKTITGKEDVIIKNNSGTDLKDLVFHLYADSYNNKETMPAFSFNGKDSLTQEQKGDISVDKVILDGKEVKFTQDNQVLKISIDKELKNGEEITATIQFKLKLPMGTSRLGYTDTVYSLTNWYPILSMYNSNESKWDETPFNTIGESNYSDTSDYNVDITVPKNFVVVATGKETEESSEKDRKVVNLNASNVRDFVIIMSPDYKVVSKEIDGIKVNSYYLSKDNLSSIDTAQKVLDSSVDAVKFFSEKFGKYPYEELDMVETYLSGGAMEYPQLVQMPKYSNHEPLPASVNDSHKNIDYEEENPFILEAAVHEVGHQWWYVSVGNNEFKESFLDESLTAFSTAYYFEKSQGEFSQNGIVNSLRLRFAKMDDYMMSDELQTPCVGSSVDKFKSMSIYSMTIYGKGALIFEDLRKKVGENTFLDIMQTYFNEYKFKNATIEGLLNIIEKKAGKSVRDYINTAIYSEKYTTDNLKLTDAEVTKVMDEQLKDRIKKMESINGLVLGSLYLKVLNGENAIIVKPSNLSEVEKSSLNNIINSYFSKEPKNVVIKEDKDLTDDDIKNNNLLLLGNPGDNKILNSIAQSLPIQISKDAIASDNFTFKNENISGSFITKNPKSEGKLILVSFWTKDMPFNSTLDLYSGSQFTISVDYKQFFEGNF